MKLEDIQKKQPFEMPNEAHFDSISSKIYAQLDKEEQEKKQNVEAETRKYKTRTVWLKPQYMGIAATILLLLITLVGAYKYSNKTRNSPEIIALETTQKEKIDFSKIPTEQINEFLLSEDISDNELISFIPNSVNLGIANVLEESDLNYIDSESLDLMLEEEYL